MVDTEFPKETLTLLKFSTNTLQRTIRPSSIQVGNSTHQVRQLRKEIGHSSPFEVNRKKSNIFWRKVNS